MNEPSHEATREIHALHVFLAEWFSGRCPNDEADLVGRCLGRLSDDFVYLLPGGEERTGTDLAGSLRGGWGTNPRFDIRVRNVRIRHEDEHCVVAFYEEYQRNALNSEPADNARISTVVFRREGGRLRWHHLQETWMPAHRIKSDAFDFG